MIKKYKDIIILLGCLIVISQIYLYTMFPAFKNDDSPETITASYNLGISHAPGYPLFTMVGKVFSLLPMGSPDFRVNTFAIFLAMLVLLLSYFIIRQITLYVFSYEDKIINFLGVFILAFSYIFWNQAIEAKGGIYILNLLFLSALIYSIIKLLKSYNIKYIYLISFIFGLSLANHWPSMIILLPFFGYLFIKYRKEIKQKNVITAILLLFAGLSPYLYLPVRGGADNIFIFAARPNTWENFWWTVLRAGYGNFQLFPSFQLFKVQIKEFFMLLLNNYSIFWILIFAGGYIIFRKSKELFYLYLSAVLIIIFTVVVYNRSNESSRWVIDVFLMPCQYILVFLIILGIYLVLKLLEQKIIQYVFIIAVFVIMVLMGYKNFEKNNSRYDYQAYDFGYNILKTMDKDSLYLCEGDDYIAPLYYIQIIEKQRQDIKFTPVEDLFFKWGMDNYIKRYGNISIKANDTAYNLNSIIYYFAGNNVEIFKSTGSPILDKLNNYNFKQTGLLKKYLKNDKPMPPEIFEIYSYNRGLYDKYIDYNTTTLDLVTFYLFCTMQQGFELLSGKNPTGALQLFNKAILFPFRGEMKENEPGLYYEMSRAYKDSNDKENQKKYLRNAIEVKENYWQAYEELGEIYQKDGNLQMAKAMFERAIQYECDNRPVIDQYIYNINKRLGNIK